jgi:hypothetical protein
MTTDATQPEAPEEEDEYALPLTENAVVRVTVKRTFSHRGHSHWPGVEIEDGPMIIDEVYLDEDGSQRLGQRVETGEELVYRVNEIAHRTMGAVVARMRRDIDADLDELEARRAARNADTQKEH